MSEKVKIGISIGDINGVGPEVIIKTFMDPRMLDFCTPIIYGSSKILSYHQKTIDAPDFNWNTISKVENANPLKINIIDCWQEEVAISFGQSTSEAGKYAFKSLECASIDLFDGKIDALVTAPINKSNIQSDEFHFSGHTEYLSDKFNSETIMLMTSENLRVGLATNHLPLNEVAKSLSADGVFAKIKILNASLIRDFGIIKPKIAVLGLNPHAGDDGLIGKEEQEIIIPGINNTKSIGITAFGPYSADGFFGSGSYKKFDAVLAMYHDQGLIPFKSLSFGEGVNYTAGLSAIRTSPDHGTAYEIAGKNLASEDSFRSAVYLACDIYKKRKYYEEINTNPLKVKKNVS